MTERFSKIKILISITLVLFLTLGFKIVFEAKFKKKNLVPYNPQLLKNYKGSNLYVFIGDIAVPNDNDTSINKITFDPTVKVYDSFIISSTLTQNGESWTWLPKSVGETINIVDPDLYESYKDEILDGINWRRTPIGSTKEFIVPEKSRYGQLSHIKSIYAISLFNSIKEIKDIKNRKEKLKKGISTSIKSILEEYVATQKDNNKVSIPALSGIWGTLDADYYLTYFESWSSIFEGLQNLTDMRGISEIYFVIWEQLIKDKEHLNQAVNGFLEAYNIFNNTYTFPIFLVGLISSIFGLLFFFIKTHEKTKFDLWNFLLSIIPSLLTLFGLLKNDILSYNMISFINKHYFYSAFILGLVCFYWSSFNITSQTQNQTG